MSTRRNARRAFATHWPMLAPDMPVRIIAGDFNEEAGEAAARQISRAASRATQCSPPTT
jgi:endonuclease/exonuclease/phosphatase family metal-dependent hydrolase